MKKLYSLLILLALAMAGPSVLATTASFTERNVVSAGETMEFATGTYTAGGFFWGPSGGALFVSNGGTATFTGDVTFSGNAGEPGGAIFIAADGVFEINGFTLTLTSCTSGSRGGGFQSDGNLYLDGDIVAFGNYSSEGGALNVNGSALCLTGNISLTDNTTNALGGAIAVQGHREIAGTALIGSVNSTVIITDNETGVLGGAIAHDNTDLIITGSVIDISRNTCGADYGEGFKEGVGGAIYGARDVTFNVTAGGTMTAVGNYAFEAGGFIANIICKDLYGNSSDNNVNFNIGAGAVATIGDANDIAGNIANGTDSIVGFGLRIIDEVTYGEGIEAYHEYTFDLDESSKVDLVKTGDGTLVLNQVNVYTGDTVLEGGKTVVNGVLYGEINVNLLTLYGNSASRSSDLDHFFGIVEPIALNTANTGTTIVNSTATLAGSGTINGAVEVKAGGTLAPGWENGAVAALTVNALSMENGSVMEILFGSQVVVSDNTPDGLLNAVTIDGGSMLKMLDADLLTLGAEFTLISNLSGTDIDGTFGTVTLDGMTLTDSGGGLYAFSGAFISGTLQLSYDGGMSGQDLTVTVIDLQVVPEPGTWALMLGGLGVLGYLQRARRNRVK